MRLLISSGELSGDYHAAHLLRAIRLQCEAQGIPLEVAAVGCQHLPPLADDLWEDCSDWAGIGLFESLKRGPKVALALLRIKQRMRAWKPDLVIAVDYRVMHVRLLEAAKSQGAKTAYYFPPVHWGSSRSKARKVVAGVAQGKKDRFDYVAAAADLVLLTYPISEEHYRRAGANVTYIGHPLANALESELTRSVEEVRQEWGDPSLLIGVLPGSRDQEIRDHLPVLIPAINALGARFPEARWYLSIALPRYRKALERWVATLEPAVRERVTLIEGADPNLLRASDLLLIKSGTAAQTGLMLGVPMVAFYRIVAPFPLQPLWLLLTRQLFINLEHWTFPNILAGRAVIPELIQEECTSEQMIATVGALLDDSRARHTMAAELLVLREQLYRPDAIERAAALCLDLVARP